MTVDLVEIIEADGDLSSPDQSQRLRRLWGAVMSAAQIDVQSDTLTERLGARVAQIENRVRGAWRERWQFTTSPHRRQAAAEELGQLLRAREQERRRYLFGMECVLALRSEHIKVIERAIAEHPDAPEAVRLLESDFCRSFSILLADGTEVVPFRVRDADRRVRAFKVSNGGNKNADAQLVYDEDELRKYVVERGYRVRCKSREGTRIGLYTAASPNRVFEAFPPQRAMNGGER